MDGAHLLWDGCKVAILLLRYICSHTIASTTMGCTDQNRPKGGRSRKVMRVAQKRVECQVMIGEEQLEYRKT